MAMQNDGLWIRPQRVEQTSPEGRRGEGRRKTRSRLLQAAKCWVAPTWLPSSRLVSGCRRTSHSCNLMRIVSPLPSRAKTAFANPQKRFISPPLTASTRTSLVLFVAEPELQPGACLQAEPARTAPAPLAWTKAPAHALPFDDDPPVDSGGESPLYGDGGEREGADLANHVWVPVGARVAPEAPLTLRNNEPPAMVEPAPSPDHHQLTGPAVSSGAVPRSTDHQWSPTPPSYFQDLAPIASPIRPISLPIPPPAFQRVEFATPSSRSSQPPVPSPTSAAQSSILPTTSYIPQSPPQSPSSASKVLIEEPCICANPKCDTMIGVFGLYGFPDVLKQPHARSVLCNLCSLTGAVASISLEPDLARGKRKRAGAAGVTAINCDACDELLGVGGIRCPGGNSFRAGRWRPKEMFAPGRRTCQIPHIRLKVYRSVREVLETPQELFTGDPTGEDTEYDRTELVPIIGQWHNWRNIMCLSPRYLHQRQPNGFSCHVDQLNTRWEHDMQIITTAAPEGRRRFISVAWAVCAPAALRPMRGRRMHRSTVPPGTIPWGTTGERAFVHGLVILEYTPANGTVQVYQSIGPLPVTFAARWAGLKRIMDLPRAPGVPVPKYVWQCRALFNAPPVLPPSTAEPVPSPRHLGIGDELTLLRNVGFRPLPEFLDSMGGDAPPAEWFDHRKHIPEFGWGKVQEWVMPLDRFMRENEPLTSHPFYRPYPPFRLHE
ncbi:hypothetical protein BDK51DRAFT_49853 [Blyttiomyces helicus]|uniref:Uncharacterized protein n=1 Tax=Blyttiomyces helicus TaxID=388810 RepID=A0A4V1IRQ4_9FUNG|nr:hypothetical protein BDK51DRAFT_49853 [Blyttiomyces helicus]|eukprot:RKO90867.1 hypothetical protein BDK51DRAFT_49853 [Blyttiomyces helicus]